MRIIKKSLISVIALAVLFGTLFCLTACDNTPEKTYYSVTFIYNKPVPVGDSSYTKTVESGHTVTAPTVIISDYILDGWFTDDATFKNKFNFETPITNNLTLYAKWSKDISKRLAFFDKLDENAVTAQTYSKVSYTNTTISKDYTNEPISNGKITLEDSTIVDVKMTSQKFTELYITGSEIILENYTIKQNNSTQVSISFEKDEDEFIVVMSLNNENYITSIAYLKNSDEIYYLKNFVYSSPITE